MIAACFRGFERLPALGVERLLLLQSHSDRWSWFSIGLHALTSLVLWRPTGLGTFPGIAVFLLSTTGQWCIFGVGVFLIVWALRFPARPKKLSPNANLIAYRTVGITVIAVDFAMKAWADYVAAGNATSEQETKVRKAYNRYQATGNAAKVALRATSDTSAPPALASAAAELVAFVVSATGVVASMLPEAPARLADDDEEQTFLFAAPLLRDDEKAVLLSRLSEVTGSVGFSASQNDPGSMSLMKSFANVFRRAGWTVIREEPMWLRGLDEIHIEAHSQDSTLARFVQTVLKSIDVRTKCIDAPKLPGDQIQIKIGKTKW